jgi:hypothetical protein
MTITWTIAQCEHLVATGFITVAHWRATAVDGDYSASVYSTCGWSEGVVQIPYANVTEQEVLDWCWTSGVDKDATEANLASQIDLQKNPVQAPGLPWAV